MKHRQILKPFVLILSAALLLSACSAFSQPSIYVETTQFEFGDVENGTIMTREITVTNQGSASLEINTISTSCGCTQATVDQMILEPGESTTLHIEFDSGAHGPELTGELMRQVFIHSNDPKMETAEVQFTANIIAPTSP